MGIRRISPLPRSGCLPLLWRRLLSSVAAFAEDVSLEELLEEKFKLLDTQGAAHVNSEATYASLLRQCARALSDGKRVHAHIVSSGRAPSSFLGNLLVQMYGKCGSLKDARDAFDAISQRNVFSWSLMISAYAQKGHFREALDLFHRMDSEEGVEPDLFRHCQHSWCVLQLVGFTNRQKHPCKDSFWELAIQRGRRDCTAQHVCKVWSVEDARRAFDAMQEKDVISWNAMVAAYAQHGHGRDAIELYHSMNWEGIQADEFTFSTILRQHVPAWGTG